MTPLERVTAIREEALGRGDLHLVRECDAQLDRWHVVLGDDLQAPILVRERAVPRKNTRAR